MRHLGDGILGDPAPLERILEEGREDTAPVVVRLHPGPALLQERCQGSGGQLGHGLAGEGLDKPFQLPANPRHLRGRDLVLLELVLLRGDVVGHGFVEFLLPFRLAIVREREIDVEGERAGLAFEPAKDRLGFVELCVGKTCDGRARIAFAEPIHFLHRALGLSFGARLEVFPKALAVEAGVELKNDFPGGIREL